MIVALGYSQEDYPKLQLIDGDTVAVFSPEQVTKMNTVFIELDKQKELNVSYSEEVDLCKENVKNLSLELDGVKKSKLYLSKISKEQSEQLDVLELDVSQKRRKIEVLKKSRNLFTAIGAVAGFIGGHYFTKTFLP